MNTDTDYEAVQITDEIILVPLDKIVANPYQPRTTMDPVELEALAQSISRNSMMQKPTARRRTDGCYELAFGNRRYEAHKLLAIQHPGGFEAMPLIIRELSNEQMFEFAWEENRRREDINPIDQGEAYAIYMREFNKTSKEAGEYFDVSEETIRQKMRYGKLPEPVKEKMRKGEVNENTARALLTMQRVTSDKIVIETVKQIKKDRDEATPEEVIQNVLEDLDDVVGMWESYQGSDPRGGSHGWPLSMKKFPNHLLPALSVAQTKEYEKQMEHLVNPPVCTACPFYTKLRGDHYCGLKVCFDRKTIAWRTHVVEQASKQTGIAIYNEGTDGIYRPLDREDKTLFTKKNKDLRLVPGNAYQNFTDLDDDHVVVVATGAALDLLYVDKSGGSSASKKGKRTETEKQEMRRMKVFRMRRKDLMWEYTAIAKSIFDSTPLNVLSNINRWHNIMIDDSMPDASKHHGGDRADYQRRALVWRLITQDCSHYRRQGMITILNDFEKRTGVKAPKSLIKRAEEWDAEIKAAGEKKVAK